MDYSLQNLKEIIEKWKKINYLRANNKNFVTNDIKLRFQGFQDFYFDKKNSKLKLIGSKIYLMYCYGKHVEIDMFFKEDRNIIGLMSKDEKINLIETKQINIIVNNALTTKTHTSKLKNPPGLDLYRINNEDLRKMYYRLIKRFILIKEILQIFEELSINKTSNINVVPSNPHPDIFKNGFAFKMFEELRAVLTKNEDSIAADYGFIYHKMKAKPLYAIIKIVTHRYFITFLNSHYDTKLKTSKLPHKEPKYKKPIYSQILSKYQTDIINTEQK